MEAANWGSPFGALARDDNAEARQEPASGSAYEQGPPEPGVVAKPRGFKVGLPEDKEPLVVWFLVVGSIAGLLMLGKWFNSAKA